MSKKKRKIGTEKRKKKADMPSTVEDVGPIERWRHRFGMASPSAVVSVAKADVVRSVAVLEIRDRTVDGGGRVTGTGAFHKYEQPLDYMFEQGWFGDRHTEEGERLARWRHLAGTAFRDQYESASIERRVTANLDNVGCGGIYHDESDDEAEARMEFNNTVRSLGSMAKLTMAVCCNRYFLPQGNAVMLKILIRALDHLSERFHIADDERKRRSRIRGGPL